MKFSVGYQFVENNTLIEAILKHHDSIGEVYFSWGDIPNGRNTENIALFSEPMESKIRLLSDLKVIRDNGIKLNLLLNGNCYGKYAQSRVFFNKLGDTIDFLKNNVAVDSITTTSPLIAKFVKQNFPGTEVRASINMEIGTTEGMDYISEFFDSFYLKREYNRNLEKIKIARAWCDKNGKRLYGLANSGCLNFCSAHTFHDNLVAHENEISEIDNAYQFEGQCWEYLKKEDKRARWLSFTNFIRPEDIYRYEGLFEGLKLATRVNKNPTRVIEAYCNASYNGAITDILEPSHSALFYPAVIDNKSILPHFAETVMTCRKNCDQCGYCEEIQRNSTVIL